MVETTSPPSKKPGTIQEKGIPTETGVSSPIDPSPPSMPSPTQENSAVASETPSPNPPARGLSNSIATTPEAPSSDSSTVQEPTPTPDRVPTSHTHDASESDSNTNSDSIAPSSPPRSSNTDSSTRPEVRKAYVGVLPCGIRLITTEDKSLPVAAVMLAIEIGTRDDPPKLPGLVHALAYHLQQGNRELPPGGLLTEIHDAGGIASMAVGFAQVRYGSLVPISYLQRAIWLEAQRLRAPTIESGLWLKSLHYAGKDIKEKDPPPPQLLAGAWQEIVPSTNGRGVSNELAQLSMPEVASHLARFFDYRRSTLIVVGPQSPKQLWKLAAEQFSDLPARPRFPFRDPFPQRSQDNEIRLQIAGLPPNLHVWPVPLDPKKRFWSRVLCEVMDNRIIKTESEKPQRIQCNIRDDARRPLMQVRVIGSANLQFRTYFQTYYQEMEADVYQEIAAAQTDLEFATHTPLDLATRLAFIPDFAFNLKTTPFMTELPNLLGIPPPQSVTTLPGPLFEWFERANSVYVNPPSSP